MRRVALFLAVWLGATGEVPAAVVDVALQPMAFVPAEVTVRVGDTVRWSLPAPSGSGSGGYFPEPMGIAHTVTADDGAFRSGDPAEGPWQFAHVFTRAGIFRYYCERHGAPGGSGMSGTVVVQTAALQINEGMAGAWFNPATTGQGFFFDVHPGSNLFGLAWFTWTDVAGSYDWLTGVGRYAGASTQVTLTRTQGGRFNAPLAVSSGDAGTASITFSDCTRAHLDFSLAAPARSGSIELVKLLPASPLCVPPAPSR